MEDTGRQRHPNSRTHIQETFKKKFKEDLIDIQKQHPIKRLKMVQDELVLDNKAADKNMGRERKAAKNTKR